jgi:hypothetical protein
LGNRGIKGTAEFMCEGKELKLMYRDVRGYYDEHWVESGGKNIESTVTDRPLLFHLDNGKYLLYFRDDDYSIFNKEAIDTSLAEQYITHIP